MDRGRFLIETHLRTGKPIKVLARSHGVSASWLFKLTGGKTRSSRCASVSSMTAWMQARRRFVLT
jgi:hypothetical protein